MLANPLNNRSRSVPPALGPLLAVVATALVLCCALSGSALAQNGDDAPAVDWSQDTVALNPDGSPAAKTRQYAVQVALVRDIGSARELAADLVTRGHDPYILTMADDDGALWHAVRLDIHDGFVSAFETAREFYQAEGVPPSIVQLGSLRGLPLEEARFFVQTAAFESKDNAMRLAVDLESRGMDAGVVRRKDADGALWYVVHIGVFDSFEDAAARADEYTEETDCECFVVAIARELLEKSSLPLPESSTDAAVQGDTDNATEEPDDTEIERAPTNSDNGTTGVDESTHTDASIGSIGARPTAAPDRAVPPAHAMPQVPATLDTAAVSAQ